MITPVIATDKNFLVKYLKGLNDQSPDLYDFFLTEAAHRGLYDNSNRGKVALDYSRKQYKSQVMGNAKFAIQKEEKQLSHHERV